MKRAVVILALSVALAAPVVTGCSASSVSGGGATTPAATSSASPTASLTCADFDMAAAHMTTYVHYLKLDVGTTNDPAEVMTEMKDAMGVLTTMAPTCKPSATGALAEFATAIGATEAAFVPGTDAAAVAADKAALAALDAKGIAAWKAMDIPTIGWENDPTNAG